MIRPFDTPECTQGLEVRHNTCNVPCSQCGFHKDEVERRRNIYDRYGLSLNEKGLRYLKVIEGTVEPVAHTPLNILRRMGFTDYEILASIASMEIKT